MSNTLTIAPSPHLHGVFQTRRLMFDVVIALLPAWIVGLFFFGIGALIVTLISVVSCVAIEYLLQRFVLKQTPSISDGSAIVTGLLLAMNVPSNLPWWIILIGAIMAIGVGKMSFGGLGNNLFNPALFARAFLLVSFPVQMTTWPVPITSRLQYLDAVTGATPLSAMKAAIKGGANLDLPSTFDMFFGQIGGSLGEVSALALLVGFVYLLLRKVISWHIPVAIFASVFVLSGIFYLVDPTIYANPLVELCVGGLMLGAIFMATDYVTSPMSKRGGIVFGCGIGLLTVAIRTWGAYPEGVSFAILIMNAFVPLIDRYMKPRKFGHKRGGK